MSIQRRRQHQSNNGPILRARCARLMLVLSLAIFTLTTIEAQAHTSFENEISARKAASPFLEYETSVSQSLHSRGLSSYRSLGGAMLNMIDYIRSHIDPESRADLQAHIPRYNRMVQFGGWINDNPQASCYDTRAKVLLRDMTSDAQPTFKQGTCQVVSARWIDPYTFTEFKIARSVQIDHVVPLKNAYLSGAYAWDSTRRCHYANYLKNNFHLLAVSGHENMSKSDAGPERYMPPNEAFHCTYLHLWMKIKMIWNLNVSPDEEATIERMLIEKNCPVADIAIDANEYREQNALSQMPPERCKYLDQTVDPSQPVVQ